MGSVAASRQNAASHGNRCDELAHVILFFRFQNTRHPSAFERLGQSQHPQPCPPPAAARVVLCAAPRPPRSGKPPPPSSRRTSASRSSSSRTSGARHTLVAPACTRIARMMGPAFTRITTRSLVRLGNQARGPQTRQLDEQRAAATHRIDSSVASSSSSSSSGCGCMLGLSVSCSRARAGRRGCASRPRSSA